MMANPPPLVNVAVAYAAFKWGGINLFNGVAAPNMLMYLVVKVSRPFHLRDFWAVLEITKQKEK